MAGGREGKASASAFKLMNARWPCRGGGRGMVARVRHPLPLCSRALSDACSKLARVGYSNSASCPKLGLP